MPRTAGDHERLIERIDDAATDDAALAGVVGALRQALSADASVMFTNGERGGSP